jgi:hypothetical protein
LSESKSLCVRTSHHLAPGVAAIVDDDELWAKRTAVPRFVNGVAVLGPDSVRHQRERVGQRRQGHHPSGFDHQNTQQKVFLKECLAALKGGGHKIFGRLTDARGAPELEIFDLNTCDAGLAGNFRFEYACGGLAKRRDPAAHCAASTPLF